MNFVVLVYLLLAVNWGICQTTVCEEHCEKFVQFLNNTDGPILSPADSRTFNDNSSEIKNNQSEGWHNNSEPRASALIYRDNRYWKTYRRFNASVPKSFPNGSGNWTELPPRLRSILEDEGGVEEINDYRTLDYVKGDPITILNRYLEVEEKQLLGSFPIDRTLGLDTRVLLTMGKSQRIQEIRIVGENISVADTSSSASTFYVDCKPWMCDFRFKYLNPGVYSYYVTLAYKEELIHVTVQSRPRVSNPIYLKCHITEILRTTRNNTALMPLYMVMGIIIGLPLMNATVYTVAKTPAGPTAILRLRDNGIYPDTLLGDGIYSAHFTKFNGTGNYKFAVYLDEASTALLWMEQQEETIVLPNSEAPSDSLWFKTLRFTRPMMRYTPCSAGGIENGIEIAVKEGRGNMYPPSPVMDLEVIGINMKLEKFTIKFTATGSSLTSGKANVYICRYSKEAMYLRHYFDKCSQLHDVALENPVPAFEVMLAHIKFPGIWSSHVWFVALKACNEEGECSEVSNVVPIPLNAPPSPFMPLGPIRMPNELFISQQDPLYTLELKWPEVVPGFYRSNYSEDIPVIIVTEDYFDEFSSGAAVDGKGITIVAPCCLLLSWLCSVLLSLP